MQELYYISQPDLTVSTMKLNDSTMKLNVSVCLLVSFLLNLQFYHFMIYAENKCMIKVNNRNTKRRYQMCSKLTIKTLER